MRSRKQIKQCFNCRNNIKCWGLDLPLLTGKYEEEIKIKRLATLRNIIKMLKTDSFFDFEYYVIRLLMETINPVLKNEGKLAHAYTSQIMAMVGAHANANNDDWGCPCEYDYTPLR